MELLGTQFIGHTTTADGKDTFQAVDPSTGEKLLGDFHEATQAEIEQACDLAEWAFRRYSRLTAVEQAGFLEAIAEEIMALGHALIMRAENETRLPFPRLEGERARTVNQLKLLAEYIREGTWVDARIDRAIPDRTPLPKPDVRQVLRPLGPVAIFGASNFPLAFSVAGGDTASALASGCTVVVKGHPAHPGTSEMIAQAILKAAAKTQMPEGVFSLVQGQSHEVGTWLVKHPNIQAVGFTGSFKGGKALYDTANRREIPIPVFAEMGSTNPIFILPQALEQHHHHIAEGLANSITLGVGQFCTNPGMTFLSPGAHKDDFHISVKRSIEHTTAGTMLSSGIKDAYMEATDELIKDPAIDLLCRGLQSTEPFSVPANIFWTGYQDFKKRREWWHEIFGPCGMIINTESKEDLYDAASHLEGHLTATVHGTEQDLDEFRDLFEILERKVGRVVVNGYPTGVEVCQAMVHGGPYPATSAPQSTSVGTNAIKLFARPVCYQDYPQDLLPEALKDPNTLDILRMVDGIYTRAPIS